MSKAVYNVISTLENKIKNLMKNKQILFTSDEKIKTY